MREKFRRRLAPPQREAFDELEGLRDAPRTDLVWSYAAGGPLGPEAALREMGRLTRTWLDFHEGPGPRFRPRNVGFEVGGAGSLAPPAGAVTSGVVGGAGGRILCSKRTPGGS